MSNGSTAPASQDGKLTRGAVGKGKLSGVAQGVGAIAGISLVGVGGLDWLWRVAWLTVDVGIVQAVIQATSKTGVKPRRMVRYLIGLL
jgi:hypothetical protein